jgi:hypothetical protein
MVCKYKYLFLFTLSILYVILSLINYLNTFQNICHRIRLKERLHMDIFRFKLTDNPKCPCNEGVKTPEHLIYFCKLLEVQRSSLKQHIMADGGNGPTPNRELVASYLKSFSRFVKSIDFNKLQ